MHLILVLHKCLLQSERLVHDTRCAHLALAKSLRNLHLLVVILEVFPAQSAKQWEGLVEGRLAQRMVLLDQLECRLHALVSSRCLAKVAQFGGLLVCVVLLLDQF